MLDGATLERLRAGPVFAAAGHGALEELCSRAQFFSHAEGALVTREGETSRYAWALLDGSVAIIYSSKEGLEVTVKVLPAPCVFGEMELFFGLSRHETVRALEPIEVIRFPKDAFLSFLAHEIVDPALPRQTLDHGDVERPPLPSSRSCRSSRSLRVSWSSIRTSQRSSPTLWRADAGPGGEPDFFLDTHPAQRGPIGRSRISRNRNRFRLASRPGLATATTGPLSGNSAPAGGRGAREKPTGRRAISLGAPATGGVPAWGAPTRSIFRRPLPKGDPQ